MAGNTVQICKFHHFGYCKFGDKCEKFHSKETCEKFPCHDDNCSLRHPKPCKYYSTLGKCKFGTSCGFLHSHVLEICFRKEIESLTNKIDRLKERNNEIIGQFEHSRKI